jgi:hypothetical protein
MDPRQILIKEVKAFDPCSLLHALGYLGYQWDDLFFEGISHSKSASSIWEKIDFYETGYPKVCLTVNLGLLSNFSPLPSFFFRKIDLDPLGGERLIRFLNFFNHHLLKEFFESTLLENNEKLFPNWIERQRDYFSLLGLNSVSTIHFLMTLSFPEFDVLVDKQIKHLTLENSGLFLGKGALGDDSSMGGRATKTFSSFKVTLFTDEEFFGLFTPWPLEIQKRLDEMIFPLVRRVDIHLTVTLIIRGKEGHLTLCSDSHLGFDRIGKSSSPFELLIFYGHSV